MVHKLDRSHEPPVYRSLQCGNQQLSQPRFQLCARRDWFAAILMSSVQRWRLDSLASIISCIVYCSRKKYCLRSHVKPTDGENNPGNFLALLKFRADAGDEVLANHFSQATNRAKYTSPTIQNELISILGEQIRESIVSQIPSDAPYFSTLAYTSIHRSVTSFCLP